MKFRHRSKHTLSWLNLCFDDFSYVEKDSGPLLIQFFFLLFFLFSFEYQIVLLYVLIFSPSFVCSFFFDPLHFSLMYFFHFVFSCTDSFHTYGQFFDVYQRFFFQLLCVFIISNIFLHLFPAFLSFLLALPICF